MKRAAIAKLLGRAIAVLGLGLVFGYGIAVAVRNGLNSNGSEQLLRITHWQLEPGFREALQQAIDDYNAQAAIAGKAVRVEQTPLPLELYKQFLNVHLLAGTAPDIMQVGDFSLAQTHAANFLLPLDGPLGLPSAYDAGEDLVGTWRQHFNNDLIDGRLGTDGRTYRVPLAAGGTQRIFYNDGLLQIAKEVLYRSLELDVAPAWLQGLLADDPDSAPVAISRDSSGLRRWAASPAPPETFGQFVLVCEALQLYASLQRLEDLVPIAAHKQVVQALIPQFQASFIHPRASEFDFDSDGLATYLEFQAALDTGLLELSENRVRALFAMWRRLVEFFPPGFQGLERDHAMRRFLSGSALFLPAGSWDAAGILGTGEVLQPRSFRVGVMGPVVPGPNDRWGRLSPQLANETQIGGGLHFAVRKESPLADYAVDFLQYLTSTEANQTFINRSGWLPIVRGVQPHPVMQPFMPRRDGVHPGMMGGFFNRSGSETLNNLISAYVSGGLAYPIFSREYLATLRNPRLGLERAWYDQREAEMQRVSQLDRSMEAVRFLRTVGWEKEAAPADLQRQLLYESQRLAAGARTIQHWRLAGYDRAFPEF